MPPVVSSSSEIEQITPTLEGGSVEVETFVCEHCGESFPMGERVMFQDKEYCDDCLDDNTTHCSRCNTRVWDAETSDVDGEEWCEQCATEFAFTCSDCDCLHPNEEQCVIYDGESTTTTRNQDPQYVCSRCYENSWRCVSCGARFSGSSSDPLNNGEDWCACCVETHLSYCDNCDEYYHPDDGCSCSEDDIDTDDEIVHDNYDERGDHGGYRDPATNFPRGAATHRFTTRFVGLEMETGHGASGRAFIEAFRQTLPHWGIHSDGSLRNGGREFVSPPISGATIEKDLGKFYELTQRHSVHVQDVHAGAHVHVDASDIFNEVGEKWDAAFLPESKRSFGDKEFVRAYKQTADKTQHFRPKLLRRQELMEDTIQAWGDLTTALSRQLIPSERRRNTYCIGDFAIRGGWHRTLVKAKEGGYPAIAIRDNTFEFRSFMSTDILSEHMAKVEFAQKTVEWLRTVTQDPVSKRRDKAIAAYRRMVENLDIDTKLPMMKEMLGMSDETLTELANCFRAHLSSYRADLRRFEEERQHREAELRRREEERRRQLERQEQERREREQLLARANELWAEALANRERLREQSVPVGTFCQVCQQVH